jgi:DNA-binding phage protein
MIEKLTTFDPAEHLKSDRAIADFMAAAFETNDPACVAHALGVVARAEGNPTLRTTLAVMKALGIALSAKPATVH